MSGRDLVVLSGAGGKSGGKQKRPVETADSLHSVAYAHVLDLISEGEIVGLVNGEQSVYYNSTPLKNPDATYNFDSVTLDVRTGTQFQPPIPGFPAAQSETGIGVGLEQGSDYIAAYSNTDLSALRVRLAVPALSKLEDNGDLVGHRVAYEIALQTDGGAWITAVAAAFDGKTTQLYERSHRVELPDATTGWSLRIRRITAQANSVAVQDTTVIQSITTIIDAKLRYPMSALVGTKIDARQFNAIPTRAYHMRGRIVRIPSNYDPVARTYSGLWNGTWATGYTNNPAWVFLDLVTNDRYGLGQYVTLGQVDKWSLYRIAVYCDDLVDNGLGALEPRFTCNCYLQGRADAWKVLQDIASIFRGIAYYAAGSVFASADMPTDPVYTYTAANVIDGLFEYQGSPRTSRATVALVSWNDLTDFGRAKVEAVDDPTGIARYGIRQVELTAFGCTSQAQARRVGKWALLTSRLETDVCTFAVGLDGTLVVPGQIIRIADPNRAGRRIGGRIQAATGSVVTTDAAVVAAPGDRLTVITSAGIAETRTVTSAVGLALTIDSDAVRIDSDELSIDQTGIGASTTTLTVSPPFSEAPAAGTIWALESSLLWAQTYRVLAVAEREGLTFGITAVQHEAGKYDATDYGTIIQPRPISVVPPGVQAAPGAVELTSYYVIEQGLAGYVARIVWTPAPQAVAYEVEWRRNRSEWVRMARTGSTSAEIRGIYRGAYIARVRAVNALDVASVWMSSVETQLDGKVTAPPSLATLTATTDRVFAIELEWGFPNVPLDIARTEIYRSMTPSFLDATKLGDFAFPTQILAITGLAAGVEMWFWGRLVDTSGNIGPFTPIADPGVAGQSSASASAILDVLAGQITQTQLAQNLLEIVEGAEGSVVAIDAIESDLAALYTIKTQLTVGGRTYIAGIGVGVENNQGIIESQVLVAADRFAVLDPNGSQVSVPFVIQGGQVFMESAFIQNGAITTAKIGDAQITTAKIGSAQVGNAQIADAQITTAKIVDGNITTAKIGTAQIDSLRIAGGAVTSTAYSAGGIVNLNGGGTADLLIAVLNMGGGGGGVVIHGNIQAVAAANATLGLRIIRQADGVTLTDIQTSYVGGFAGGQSVFAFDSSPVAGNNSYLLQVYNPSSGAGSLIATQIGPSTLLAWGGKR